MTVTDERQPMLPFGEPATTDTPSPVVKAPTSGGRPALRSRVPCDEDSRKKHPPSLEAFAASWDAPTPASAMTRACADLRRRAGGTAPPFALTPMLDKLSARRSADPADVRTLGRLGAHDAGWTVYRRLDQPWRRMRFTEAHEIAHILLYEKLAHSRALLDDLHSESAHRWVEKLCDTAAAELLIPVDDLSKYLDQRPLTSIGDYHQLYDRYLVSHLALLRQVLKAIPDTALTVWSWRHHRNGANWRVQSSYCDNLPGVYIPTDISARRLSPALIAEAVDAGAATARASLDVGGRRYIGTMTAIYPSHRAQAALPMHQGKPVRDEPGGSVYVLHHGMAVSAARPTQSANPRSR